jgi:hypothetical protein
MDVLLDRVSDLNGNRKFFFSSKSAKRHHGYKKTLEETAEIIEKALEKPEGLNSSLILYTHLPRFLRGLVDYHVLNYKNALLSLDSFKSERDIRDWVNLSCEVFRGENPSKDIGSFLRIKERNIFKVNEELDPVSWVSYNPIFITSLLHGYEEHQGFSEANVDLLVTEGHGSYIQAFAISAELGIPITVLYNPDYVDGRKPYLLDSSRLKDCSRLAIVADDVTSGNAMFSALNYLKQHFDNEIFSAASLYISPARFLPEGPDFYGENVHGI